MSEPTSARQAPVNHCPYCGEDTLRPSDTEHAGDWYCLSCLRLFAVTFRGLRRASSVEVSR